MDWTDTGYAYLVEVLVVSQTNVDNTLGILRGFVLQGATVTENYYSDSRVQAKLSTIVAEGESDGYIDNARLRINITIPYRNWFKEFVTGYVTNISEKSEHGYTKRDYTIEGTLWGLLNHKISAPISIGNGTKRNYIWKSLLGTQTKMQYTADGAPDKTFTVASPIIYEVGSNLSTVLFELASGDTRMDNNGHGTVVLKSYTEPSKSEATRTIDFSDMRGLALYPLEMSSSKWEAPGRAIVTSTVSKTDDDGNTTQEVIAGYYDAPDSNFTSLATRGWLNARSDAYTGVSENPTAAELKKEAERNWKNSQGKYRTWTAGSVFADYHAGEVVNLVLNDAKKSTVKVLIQSVRTDLKAFTQELTMKEV